MPRICSTKFLTVAFCIAGFLFIVSGLCLCSNQVAQSNTELMGRTGTVSFPPFVYNDVNPYLTVPIPFKNNEATRIEFEKTSASCACSEIKTDKMTAEPGETIMATATFNLRGKKGPQHFMVGLVPKQGEAWSRSVLFEVVHHESWSVQQIHMGTVEPGKPISRVVKFQICKEKKEDIDPGISFSSDRAGVTARKVSSGLEYRPEIGFWVATYRVEVAVSDATEPCISAGTITAIHRTSDSGDKLSVSWRFLQAFEFKPNAIFLNGLNMHDQPLSVAISSVNGQPFRILKVAADQPGVDVVCRDADNEQVSHTLEMSMRRKPDMPAIFGQLTVTTSLKENPIAYSSFGVFVSQTDQVAKP